jgi:hypothetical protein
MSMESVVQLHRVEYAQVGLCSNGCLQALQVSASGQLFVVVGEQSGSLSGFLVRSNELNKATSVFRTLAVGQSAVSSVQLIVPDAASGSSVKVLAAYENAFVRSFNRRGKEFFSVELSHLTEPIRHFRLRWPSELFVAGLHTFTQYLLGSNELSAGASSDSSGSASDRIQSGIRFVCPAQITGFLVLNQRVRRKMVSVLACEDRLLRVLFDSNCETELETCGIVSCVLQLRAGDVNEAFVCYGTLDGRISLVRIDFGAAQVQAAHCWEVHLPRSRAPIQCLAVDEQLDESRQPLVIGSESKATDEQFEASASELAVGRADGTIELFSFEFGVQSSDQSEYVDVSAQPRLCAQFKASESIAGLQICVRGQVVIAVTFTGCVFALLRSEAVEGDLTERIEELEAECASLEAKLSRERTRYQEASAPPSSGGNTRSIGGLFESQSTKFALRALPGFQLNESFVLQDGNPLLVFRVSFL